jgi:hypothetical protein
VHVGEWHDLSIPDGCPELCVVLGKWAVDFDCVAAVEQCSVAMGIES